MKPRVSVITSVFNGEGYADRAVPSILEQTFTDFEYIIVDDGSTDRTLDVLTTFADQDQRVRVLSVGRQGRVRALNYAVSQARGEFIANQDFDDLSYPERLKRQVEFLDAHPSVGVVGCYYVLVDTGRAEKYIRKPPTVHEALVCELARRIPISHTHATFRKVAWQDAGGYPLLDSAQDLALWIEMAKRNWELANIPEVLGEHVEHSNSFFHSSVSQWLRHRRMARLHFKAILALRLPLWMMIYPLGRLFYLYLPDSLKRIIRRSLGGSRESDIAE